MQMMSTNDILSVAATALGAWGGFPDPPKIWTERVKDSVPMRHAAVFALVWQGGANKNALKALIGTAGLAGITYTLDALHDKGSI